jgi:hypothetical protein
MRFMIRGLALNHLHLSLDGYPCPSPLDAKILDMRKDGGPSGCNNCSGRGCTYFVLFLLYVHVTGNRMGKGRKVREWC